VILSESSKSISFLTESFSELDFKLFDTKTTDSINCFVCSGNTNVTLLKYWSQITSCIATEFQAKLNNKYLAWNIYLVFLCTETIDKTLKYKIENDKFSMRKLVIDNPHIQNDIDKLLNNEILGHDLELINQKDILEANAKHKKSELQIIIESLDEIPSGSKEDVASQRLLQLDKLVSLVNHDED
jgi:hypothetical protein